MTTRKTIALSIRTFVNTENGSKQTLVPVGLLDVGLTQTFSSSLKNEKSAKCSKAEYACVLWLCLHMPCYGKGDTISICGHPQVSCGALSVTPSLVNPHTVGMLLEGLRLVIKQTVEANHWIGFLFSLWPHISF